MTEMRNLRAVLAGLTPLPAADAADAARAEQDRRWAAGETALVEDYLAALPAVAADPEQAMVLIYGEVLARAARGEVPRLAEYQARFPHLADRLADQFAVHDALAASTDPNRTAAETLTPPGGDTTPAASPAGPLPDRVGPYTVLSELGRGGMGLVLAARDPSLDREVAVKVLIPGRPAPPDAAGRFVRESKITGRLQHPGIPPVHALGHLPDGSPFLAMKLIRGRTLDQMLRDRPAPPGDLPRLVQAFEQVCQAVGYAHSQGVIHRDLKPANVMVGDFGEVQVMDWGLAKELRAADSGVGNGDMELADDLPASTRHAEQTRAGTVMGTPSYMAPEQARGEPADARADVFALGGILCVVLTDSPPFVAADALTTLRMAAAGAVAGAHDRLAASGADSELVGIARRCLSADAAGRPADAGAVAGLVAAYRAGVEERLRKAETERAAAEAKADEARRRADAEERARAAAEAREAEQRKRRRTQLMLAAAVGLLLLGGGAFAGWQDQQQRDRKAEREADALRERFEEAKRAEAARARADRTVRALEPLVGEAEAFLRAADAGRAKVPLEAAEKQAAEPGGEAFRDRIARCRADFDLLRRLDRIDDDSWAASTTDAPRAKPTAAWPDAFRAYGIVPGETPPAEAARRVADALIRDAVLTALGRWQLHETAPDRSAALAAVLHAADPHPYRDAVRAAVSDTRATRTDAGLRDLVRRPEARAQPAHFALVAGAVASLPEPDRRAILVAALREKPDHFPVLMTLGGLDRADRKATAAARAGWFRVAAAVRPDHAVARINLGVALRDGGDLREAEAAFREAVRLAPGYALAHTNLGTVLSDAGDVVGAEEEHRAAVGLDPRYLPAHLNLGVVLLKQGDVAGAEAAYRAALALDETYAVAHHNLGNALRDKGDKDGAVAAYREAVRLDPNLAIAHGGLANALIARGQTPAAELSWREAVRLDPGNPTYHYGLGNALLRRRDLKGAADAFRAAIDRGAKGPQAHFNLGYALDRAGDHDGAAAAYRAAIKADPTFTAAYTNLGAGLADRNRTAEALEVFREAVRMSPRDAETRQNFGLMLSRTGDRNGAIKEYRAAVALDPNLAEAHYNLGNALYNLDTLAEAVAAYRAAVKADPKHARAYSNLCGALLDVGDAPGAEEAARNAVRLAPKYAQAHFNLGMALLTKGDPDGAIPAFRQAAELDPKNANARKFLDLAQKRKADRDERTAPPPRPVRR